MMGYGYGGSWGMMGGGSTFGIITWLVVIIDLILLGVWLFKKINQK